MFEVCPKIEDNCALCGKGTYNPHEQRYDDIERLFCGAAPPSYDTTVESLPKCPLKMDKREMTKYRKDKKEEWEKVMSKVENKVNFDVDLQFGQEWESRMKAVFRKGTKTEIKAERDKWAATGNIAIEVFNGDKPSGLSVTDADYWIHVLSLEGEMEGAIIFEVGKLKKKVKRLLKEKKARFADGGDYDRAKLVLIPLKDLF